MTRSLLLALFLAGGGLAAPLGHNPWAQPPNDTMIITPADARPPRAGPSEYFTGNVRVQPLFRPNAPARTSGATVTFDPGARSTWHTHPLGQTLVVTAGRGWIQQHGGKKREIETGDVIWTPPGVKHWHGATVSSAMTHMAIQEHMEGRNVEWLERVSDEQYRQL